MSLEAQDEQLDIVEQEQEIEINPKEERLKVLEIIRDFDTAYTVRAKEQQARPKKRTLKKLKREKDTLTPLMLTGAIFDRPLRSSQGKTTFRQLLLDVLSGDLIFCDHSKNMFNEEHSKHLLLNNYEIFDLRVQITSMIRDFYSKLPFSTDLYPEQSAFQMMELDMADLGKELADAEIADSGAFIFVSTFFSTVRHAHCLRLIKTYGDFSQDLAHLNHTSIRPYSYTNRSLAYDMAGCTSSRKKPNRLTIAPTQYDQVSEYIHHQSFRTKDAMKYLTREVFRLHTFLTCIPERPAYQRTRKESLQTMRFSLQEYMAILFETDPQALPMKSRVFHFRGESYRFTLEADMGDLQKVSGLFRITKLHATEGEDFKHPTCIEEIITTLSKTEYLMSFHSLDFTLSPLYQVLALSHKDGSSNFDFLDIYDYLSVIPGGTEKAHFLYDSLLTFCEEVVEGIEDATRDEEAEEEEQVSTMMMRQNEHSFASKTEEHPAIMGNYLISAQYLHRFIPLGAEEERSKEADQAFQQATGREFPDLPYTLKRMYYRPSIQWSEVTWYLTRIFDVEFTGRQTGTHRDMVRYVNGQRMDSVMPNKPSEDATKTLLLILDQLHINADVFYMAVRLGRKRQLKGQELSRDLVTTFQERYEELLEN